MGILGQKRGTYGKSGDIQSFVNSNTTKKQSWSGYRCDMYRMLVIEATVCCNSLHCILIFFFFLQFSCKSKVMPK